MRAQIGDWVTAPVQVQVVMPDLTVDLGALFDNQRRRLEVPSHPRRFVEHDFRVGDDIATDGAADGHGIGSDLCVDLATFTHNERVLAGDFSLKSTIDADRISKREFPLELRSLIDEGGKTARARRIGRTGGC